jgi:phytoene dehydrogenase-like protein
MRKFDTIVIGSGISGLTMSLILARCGQRVLLLEKAPKVGGSVARFSREGIPFDIGFHFTGGFEEGGIMLDAFRRLGLMDRIEPLFLHGEGASRMIFEREGGDFTLPLGYRQMTERVADYFPREERGVREYFRKVKEVCNNTPSMDLGAMDFAMPRLEEDFVSLEEGLRSLTDDHVLRGLLETYAMCYGVRPSEISFANHARMVMNFYESLAYVRGGGDAIVEAFMSEFQRLGVEVMTENTVAGFSEPRDGVIHEFVLDSGEAVEADNCVFTIHPLEVLRMLPEERLRKAFINRIQSYEPSVGFFGLFAVEREAGSRQEGPTIVSVFPHAEVDRLLDPAEEGWPGMVVISSVEEPVNGKRPVHVLEPVFPSQASRWDGTTRGKRPGDYTEYKHGHERNIMDAIGRGLPELKERMDMVCSASTLTFRDYLHSPDGSAYGVRQKIGQFNLVGRLPLRNLFAAGQSAVLPGLMGAMISSFIVSSMVVGMEKYGEFIKGKA